MHSRNEQRQSVSTISPHRQWTPQDAGRVTYAGRRELEDKTEGLLFEGDGEMLVKPSPSRVVAKASKWRIAGLHRDTSISVND
nr:hypothetical protein [Brucella pituitosa]